MNKRILSVVLVSTILVYVSSCYNNKEDVLFSETQVSFRSEVVPIITAGPCGCHNNGIGTRAVQFSHGDTVFYSAILSRVSTFSTWVNGGTHPGGGVIDFSPNEKTVIKKWIDQGAKDDAAGACAVVAAPTYAVNVVAIYNTTCKGGSCHGGLGPVLDYSRLTTPANKAILTSMSNSGGSSGHPNPPGAINISTCTADILKTWLALGQPQ
jgi:hypothetical protein